MTWKADDYGLCEVDLFLSFPQNDNATKNVTVPVKDLSFQNCSITKNLFGVRYKAIVLLITENGERLQTSLEEPLIGVDLLTTTTRPSTLTTTPTTISCKYFREL